MRAEPGFSASSARLEASSDEDLLQALAAGRQDALGQLYARYARLVFNLASQSLDRPSAEEIVQDVFLALWRKASSFDRAQGSVRPWLLQLAHWRILNELRRQSRRPRSEPDDEGEQLNALPDPEPDPLDRAWREERRAVVRAALAALPPTQREALSLAFVSEMTHEEVAHALDLPLGTAKTRIRSGLSHLRGSLGPMVASLLAITVCVLGWHDLQRQRALEREQRALAVVTSSDVVPVRLTPVGDVPATAHANYRARPGVGTVVLTTTDLPAAGPGRTYVAWARHGDTWTSLGVLQPDDTGTARLIAEDPALVNPPDAAEITLEPDGRSAHPNGPVILSWSS